MVSIITLTQPPPQPLLSLSWLNCYISQLKFEKRTSQVYIVSFSLGFGPIPWLLMGELLPSRARGPCAAFATGSQKPYMNFTRFFSVSLRTNWASTFLVTKTFLWLRASIGAAAVFWLYALLCAAALLFVIIVVPETRGRWQCSQVPQLT